MIQVSLNGTTVNLAANNLLTALGEWQYTIEQSAVAINGEFVPRSHYANTELNEGDEIEVVTAVGGG